MKELNFDSGLVTYKVNGDTEIRFNPADTNFVERLYTAFDSLESKQEGYRREIDELKEDSAAVFEFARQRDAEMRETIDELFQQPICDSLFANMSVYALADGLPVWMNFLLAVIDEVEANYAREQKAQSPKIEKYMKKYAKYQKRK